jgi:hypothetical protein
MCRPHEGWFFGDGTEAILIQLGSNFAEVEHASQHPCPLCAQLNLGLETAQANVKKVHLETGFKIGNLCGTAMCI